MVTNVPGDNEKGRGWTFAEVQALRRLAKQATAEAAAAVLNRTANAVRLKAFKSGISFRPAQPVALRERKS
jgi:hypothetical protein